jgi:hypothetical protein
MSDNNVSINNSKKGIKLDLGRKVTIGELGYKNKNKKKDEMSNSSTTEIEN